MWVEVPQRRGGRMDLGQPNGGVSVDGLAVEVGGFDGIRVEEG